MEHFASFGDKGLYPYLKSEERYFDASDVGSFLTLKYHIFIKQGNVCCCYCIGIEGKKDAKRARRIELNFVFKFSLQSNATR